MTTITEIPTQNPRQDRVDYCWSRFIETYQPAPIPATYIPDLYPELVNHKNLIKKLAHTLELQPYNEPMRTFLQAVHTYANPVTNRNPDRTLLYLTGKILPKTAAAAWRQLDNWLNSLDIALDGVRFGIERGNYDRFLNHTHTPILFEHIGTYLHLSEKPVID